MSASESPSVFEVHQKRGRRDLVSESKISCKLCDKNPGRVRDIRKHLVTQHQKESYFKCKARRCNFVCSISLACFVKHANREHGEFFDGRSSSFEDHEFFNLVIINPKKKETMHNKTCDLESEIGNSKKKRQIKRRSTIESKILRKFTQITESVCTDVNVAKDLYEDAFSDWKLLDRNYPRTYKRKVAASSCRVVRKSHAVIL